MLSTPRRPWHCDFRRITMRERNLTPIDRLMSHLIVDPSSGCWMWTGSCSPRGYGWFWLEGRNRRAHCASYELFRGEIPKGLVLDHLCRITGCVNPWHLEAVTTAENIRRGDTGKWQSERTHCPQGHPRNKENTKVYNGKSHCAVCGRAQDRARYVRLRGLR